MTVFVHNDAGCFVLLGWMEGGLNLTQNIPINKYKYCNVPVDGCRFESYWQRSL